MHGFIRKFVVYVALPTAFLFTLVVAGLLQEFAPDDLPAAARDAAVPGQRDALLQHHINDRYRAPIARARGALRQELEAR